MAKDFIIRKNELGDWSASSLWSYFKELPEGRYKITVTKADKRTLSQNSWIHAIIPQIKNALRDAGFEAVRTNEDAKSVVKSIFFKKEVSNGLETIEVIEGTSETSKFDFASKADDIIRWAKEYLNIDIAPPGQQFEFFE